MKSAMLLIALGLLVSQGSALFFPIVIPGIDFEKLKSTLFDPSIKLFDITVSDPGLTALVSNAAIDFITSTTGLQLPRPKVVSVRAEVQLSLSKQISVEVGLLYEKIPKPDGTVEDDTCYVRITHGYYSPILCYIEKFVCNGIVGSFPPFK